MNEPTLELFDSLSELLIYPGSNYGQQVGRCVRHLTLSRSPAQARIKKFADSVSVLSTEERQELYTRTFDINPLCALEVGWQLYGENYDRGAFIVSMRQTLRRLEIPESTELPDHLSHVLQAVGRMAPDEAGSFVREHLVVSLQKMIRGLKDKKNPYEGVLEGISVELNSRFGMPVEVASHE